jgi:phosphonate transport system substrate-binding protein
MSKVISNSNVRVALMVVLALVLVLPGCMATQGESLPYVDLRQRQPLPAAAGAQAVPFRVAVAAVISPRDTAESYQPFLDYLSFKLGRPAELVQRRTYAEINDLIGRGEVDVAFVCSSAYVIGHRDFGMGLLAAPQVKGETVYYSLLIVPVTSPAQDMADLRGKTFAFTDPWSNSGRMYPTYLVKTLGQTPETFFGRTFFTYSHDDAIRAVANGLADGAAVDSLVYQFAVARDPRLGEQIKVIHRSPPFGIPPVVTSPQLRPQVRAEVQNILLGMADDPPGRQALQALDVDRFVMIEDRAYNSVRELESQVGSSVLK